MKELLLGMGLGFIVGAVMTRSNKCFAEKVDQGVEKGKEIISDIKDEIKAPTQKTKKPDNE